VAGQRRGEPRRHHGRRAPRARRLGVLWSVALILSLSCGGEPLAPDAGLPFPGDAGDAGDAGGGGRAGGVSSATLAGTWETVALVRVADDLQRWTTTWRFDTAGACHQTVVTESLAEGFPRTTERDCAYRTNVSQVVITYADGTSVTFEFSFAGFSPDRLVLDGFEYHRLG
jgi:hypothetical protein